MAVWYVNPGGVVVGAGWNGLSAPPDTYPYLARGRVVAVYDGDTFNFKADDEFDEVSLPWLHGTFRVRLAGIDGIEHVDRRDPTREKRELQRATLRALVSDREIWLFRDPLQEARDQYGRIVAYAWDAAGGVDVNFELVRRGTVAPWVTGLYARRGEFMGAWMTLPRATQPELFRTAELVAAELMPADVLDAAGRLTPAREMPADEDGAAGLDLADVLGAE